MRRYLPIVIETISVISAVGVVISAVIYSFVFAQFGLSYIAIASLADVFRDSLRLLILVVSTAVAAFPIFLLVIHKMARGSWRKRLILAVAAGVFTAVSLLSTGYILASVGGLSFDMVLGSDGTWIVSGISVFTAIVLLLGGVVTKPLFGAGEFSLSRAISASDKRLLLILPTLWFCNSSYIVSLLMVDQMSNGLPMTVYFDTLGVCQKQRPIVVWMGDSKAVIKCRTTGKYVVKIV